jgi:hypothetical protein
VLKSHALLFLVKKTAFHMDDNHCKKRLFRVENNSVRKWRGMAAGLPWNGKGLEK